MSEKPSSNDKGTDHMDKLEENLQLLKLFSMHENYSPLAEKAARLGWDHVRFFAQLVQGEADARHLSLIHI